MCVLVTFSPRFLSINPRRVIPQATRAQSVDLLALPGLGSAWLARVNAISRQRKKVVEYSTLAQESNGSRTALPISPGLVLVGTHSRGVWIVLSGAGRQLGQSRDVSDRGNLVVMEFPGPL